MPFRVRPKTKAIKGFPGYTVSIVGIVRSPRNRVLKMESRGRVTLCNNGQQRRVRISVLVLETFVSLRPDGKIAYHRDDDLTNNRLSNLYWGTHRENVRDAIRNGKHKGNALPRSLESRKRMSLSHGYVNTKQIARIRKLYNVGWRVCDIARDMKLPYGVTYRIAKGLTYGII